jgi:hypothetical protein
MRNLLGRALTFVSWVVFFLGGLWGFFGVWLYVKEYLGVIGALVSVFLFPFTLTVVPIAAVITHGTWNLVFWT